MFQQKQLCLKTWKSSKSKTCKAEKLKLHQSVYLKFQLLSFTRFGFRAFQSFEAEPFLLKHPLNSPSPGLKVGLHLPIGVKWTTGSGTDGGSGKFGKESLNASQSAWVQFAVKTGQ